MLSLAGDAGVLPAPPSLPLPARAHQVVSTRAHIPRARAPWWLAGTRTAPASTTSTPTANGRGGSAFPSDQGPSTPMACWTPTTAGPCCLFVRGGCGCCFVGGVQTAKQTARRHALRVCPHTRLLGQHRQLHKPRRDMSVEDAIELGQRSIYHATARDAASGGTASGTMGRPWGWMC